jgi:hypothetical protein
MPQYMLLIYVPVDGPPPEQAAPESAVWMEYTQGLQDAGVLIHGAALQGVDSATTVRVRDDETQIIDGPFAETKEFLVGYWIVEVDRAERAHEIAARASAAPGPGGVPLDMPIEVRQVMSAPLPADA